MSQLADRPRQLVAWEDLKKGNKNYLVTHPQTFCMEKNLWVCMWIDKSHTNTGAPRGKTAAFVFAVEIFVQNRSVDI